MKVRSNLIVLILVFIVCVTCVPVHRIQSNVQEESKLVLNAQVQRLMQEMTWEEKLAQMILVTVPSENADGIQKKYQFGGYVLFSGDFANATPISLKKRIYAIQKSSKIPMLIAIDEEGGTVVRASGYKQFRSNPFQSPRNVYASSGWIGIQQDAHVKDCFLKSLGINTNLSPVADVAYNSHNFIYDRSFSTDYTSVSKYVSKTVIIMRRDNIVSTLKHFPGYGNNGDTHTNLIHDSRTFGTFKNRDLQPFAAGIAAGCDMIMVSHNIVHCFDAKTPASISPKVINYLRKSMGFQGVVVTDSLTMAGVRDFTGSEGESAIRAVLAGDDLLCTENYKETYHALCQAFRTGRISKKRVDMSVKRILIMKCRREMFGRLEAGNK